MKLHENQKPHVERSIAIYKVEKEATLVQIERLVDRIEQHLHILRGLEIKGFLISLEGVKSIDKTGIEALVEALIHFHVRLKVIAGFCDYSVPLFRVLLPFIQKTPLALFKTHDIMALALGTSGLHSRATILVHSDDVESRQSIASTLISHNYFVIMASSVEDVKT